METNNELKAEMLAWLRAKQRHNKAAEAAGASEAPSPGTLVEGGEQGRHTRSSPASSIVEGLQRVKEADAAMSHDTSASTDPSRDTPIPTVLPQSQQVRLGSPRDPAAEGTGVAAAAAIAAADTAEDGSDSGGAAKDRSYKQQMSFIPWHRTSFHLESELSGGDLVGESETATHGGTNVEWRPSDITTDRIASVFGEQPAQEPTTQMSAAASQADDTSEPDALPDAENESPTALAIAAARAQQIGHTTAPQQSFSPAPTPATTAMTAEVTAAEELLAPAATALHPTPRPGPGANLNGMTSDGEDVPPRQYAAAGSTPAAAGFSGPSTVPRSSGVATVKLPEEMDKLALAPPQQTSAPFSGPSNPASETQPTWPQDGFQAGSLPLQGQQTGCFQVPQPPAGQEPSLPVPLPPEDHSQTHGPGSLTGALSPQGSDASYGSLGSSASALHAAAAGMAAGGGHLSWSGMGWSAAAGGPPPGAGMGWGPVAGGPPPPPPLPPPSMAGSAWSATQVPLCPAGIRYPRSSGAAPCAAPAANVFVAGLAPLQAFLEYFHSNLSVGT